MAKFADVTYGTKGDTSLYTYIVNDNVRTGDFLQPSVKHYSSGKIFGTTAIVQSTAKETSVKGMAMKQASESNSAEPVNAYTGKELGVKAQRGEGGKFEYTGGGLGKTIKNEVTGMRQAPQGKEFNKSKYIEETRQANVKMRKASQGDTNQTFDNYSKGFMDNNQ